MTDETRTWTIWSLEAWGHGGTECCGAYGCPCIAHDDATETEIHDENACECSYTENNRFRVGTLRFADTDDTTIVGRLIDARYLIPSAHVEIEDNGDGSTLYVNDADTGEPLYALEREEG